MARRIAKFHKVSFEQFREGFMDSFGPIEEEKIKEAYDGVQLPKRATAGSAGYDFYTPVSIVLGIIDSDYFYSDNEGHIFAKITNDTNEGKVVELQAGTGFMQGIFVEYGITLDDEVTAVRNGGFGSTTNRFTKLGRGIFFKCSVPDCIFNGKSGQSIPQSK